MSRKFNKLVVLSVVVSMMLSFSIPATALPVSEAVAATTTVAPVAPVQPAAAVEKSGHIDVVPSAPAIVDEQDVKDADLQKDVDGNVKVVIELADEPTAVVYAAALNTNAPAVATQAAQAQLSKIESAQQALLAPLAKLGAATIYRTQRVYNGIAVRVKADQLESIKQLAGVKAVHALIPKELDLTTSVSTIGTPELWDSAGVGTTGEGITIGIIDSGVDYIHADFGGPAAAGAYTANDTTVVTDTYNSALLFPTMKVAGGWDFAGDSYDANPANATYQPIPHPDPDPSACLTAVDTTGHGTHVAGIAAGYGVDANGQTYTGTYGSGMNFDSFLVGPGVAPKATIYSLRVFGCAGSTDVTDQAIEWAVDPNGDGDFSDHLDVVNMSLGSSYGTAYDTSAVASDNAVLAGVAIVTSAGNSNDIYYITGAPGAATRALSTASSVDRGATMDGFRVNPPATTAGVYPGSPAVAFNWATLVPFTTTLVYPEVGANPALDQRTGCYAFNITNTQMISGNIVMINWTEPSCGGSVARTANAVAAGALGIIIVDDTDVFNLSITGSAVKPSYSAPKYVGDALKASLPVSATFTNEYAGKARLNEPKMEDVLSTFSSRGPRRVDSMLKPDITAPGDTIWSAASKTGNGGKSLNGTSMAAPHMAGAMALMVELHPGWSVEELKALLMNTAGKALRLDAPTTSPEVGPARVGAGRADLPAATQSDVVAYNAGLPGAVSVSFGVPEVNGTATQTKRIRVVNKGSQALVYSVSYKSAVDMPGVEYTYSPAIISLAPYGTALVDVTMTADASQMHRVADPSVSTAGGRSWLSEESGYILLTPGYPYTIYLPMVVGGSGSGTAVEAPMATQLRVPVYAAPKPVSTMHAVQSNLSFSTITGTATISLTGTPVDIGANDVVPNPANIVSLVSAFELQETSLNEASSATPYDHADLKYVGVTNDFMATGFVTATKIYFAVATHGNWTVPTSNEVQFNILIDTNRDGTPDYQLYNRQTGGATPNDVFYSRLFNLNTGAGSYPIPLNGVAANVLDTNVFNNNVLIIGVPASSLGLTTAAPRFDYMVETYSREYPLATPVDTTAVHTFAASAPGLDFTGGYAGVPAWYDLPTNAIPVRFNFTSYVDNGSTGALLLHHHNANGAREDVLTVTKPSNLVAVTLMHTNDFHGNLEPAGSNPGISRLGYKIKQVRNEVNDANTALLDAGDIMQSSLLSNLKKGEPTIDVYNYLGYDVATYGNHEFDWGQQVLISRTKQANFPFVVSNLVVNDTGNCATASWTTPVSYTVKPWITMTVGAPGNQAVIGILGTASIETPYITIASATQGLCFKNPAESIGHWYNDVKNAGADVIVVLSHNGNTDGGYGYGFVVEGDQTLARKLVQQGTPANIIIGGHSHTDLAAAQVISGTTVVQAHYAGRKLGRLDLVVNTAADTATVKWTKIVVGTSDPTDAGTTARVNVWAQDPAYQAQINQVVGFSNVDLIRNYNGDNFVGALVNDAVYNDLNTDGIPTNDVDIVFNNAGGYRSDITSTTKPFTLTYGLMYSELPFGNATMVGKLTGWQIMELLNQSATLFKGAIQVSGIRYAFYNYTDTLPGPQPYAWGAYSVTVKDRNTNTWGPLVLTQTYSIATNEFLAPAGQDGYTSFKYTANYSYTYWGDMLDGVNRWVSKMYSTTASAYNGPNGDGLLDGRILQESSIIPVTVLHHNDSHGRLLQSGSTPGYTNLATAISQERAHNPGRSILLSAGDNIQGDTMMAYYKTAYTGKAADGTTLPVTLTANPLITAFNAMTYTAYTLGNHEFNFGNAIFTNTLKQANYPILQANLYDTSAYGIAQVPVKSDITTTLSGGIKVAVLGIGNHRVPNYEMPSDIAGLTFTNPITEAQTRAPALKATNDIVIALTHIGFTEDVGSVEVDANVDTNLAAQTTGIDTIIGGHSHTPPYIDPKFGTGNASLGAYKYLPNIGANTNGDPVIISQANRYNTALGEIIFGVRPKAGGGYEVVSRAGRVIELTTANYPEDTRVKAIVKPYDDFLTTYKNQIFGQTKTPIDTLLAFTQETNGANLQVDASLWKLNKELSNTLDIDFHLSGAMTNAKIAAAATVTNPYTMTVGEMFTLMPYENALVVFELNGAQLKSILERGYRNYWYYKNTTNAGGYSKYTTCMLDVSAGGVITYQETISYTPGIDYVVSMTVNGTPIDFTAATTYTVSTVNYIAAGSCNFNNSSVTMWPPSQLKASTQYYVRDVVIEYVPTLLQPINPQIEGRLVFQPVGPKP